MRRNPQRPGFFIPSEHAEFYHANGFEIVDDLVSGKVLAIPRGRVDHSRREPRDGP